MRLVPLVALTLAAVIAPRVADACSCSTPGPPCSTMFHQQAVFVGKATSQRGAPGNAVTTFAVKETLFGKADATVEVGHGGPCGLAFTIGETYVVYAGGGGDGTLYTGACSRTHRLTPNDEDVTFAHALPTRERAAIDGVVLLGTDGNTKPIGGVTVRAGAESAISRADGRFHLDVPPGTYELTAEGKGLRMLLGRAPKLILPAAAACATPSVMVTWDGRIRGTLRDPSGTPQKNVQVNAIAAPGTRQPWVLAARTDEQGRYEIHEVPAGRFYVAVSPPDDGAPSPSNPYQTTYYPGTPQKSGAKAVAMQRAGVVESIDFTVPPAIATYLITGRVVDADGKPAAKAFVNIGVPAANRSTGLSADDDGRFFVPELAGVEATIRACIARRCADEKRLISGPLAVELTLPR